MAKKMFTYTETITFVVEIAAEDHDEALEAGSDFVEGVLDHTHSESKSIPGLRRFEMESPGGAKVEEQ